ncbi:MAG: (2Fe-2S)-binding protein [Gammaproteobacteria bacterium]|jgi:aerobic carbon-monoxide dehydrogenase small subunit|nr:(2Fe-2S)-binding protein [Gammaproteobacteria bacterium]
MKQYPVQFKVNGKSREVLVTADETLLDTLRNQLEVFEVKNGCEQGDCGACTVLINGKVVNACLTLTVQISGKEVTTIKGIGTDEKPHPLQKSFHKHGASQCGFCTPGMITSSKALLDENPNPDIDEIKKGISGNFCRCTGYTKILDAIESVANENQS